MKKDIYVLGTGLSHNGSVVILKNGKVAIGIEKERLTRVKHDGGNDTVAVNYCLDALGITLDEIDLVVQCENFCTPNKNNFRGERVFKNFSDPKFHTISHHLAHAYSAVGMCPYDQFNVLVVDGCGSPIEQCVESEIDSLTHYRLEKTKGMVCEKDSFYHWDGQKLQTLQKDFSPMESVTNKPFRLPTTQHSIGGFYAAVSAYCFGNLDDVGKLMGLAPYGKNMPINHKAFDFRNSRIFVRENWFTQLKKPVENYGDFENDFEHYASVAYWAQSEIEKAVAYLVRSRQSLRPDFPLAYSGGVALNAVANGKILQQDLVQDLYPAPAAADNGLALGCAYYGWLSILNQPKVLHHGSTCFGKSYGKNHISDVITRVDQRYTVSHLKSFEKVAQLIKDGNTVGWFNGGAEFGPRALGRRSILASPNVEGINDHINRNIKNREDFRPFAPAVLKEDLSKYFQFGYESPYMILVDQVKKEYHDLLKAVTHVDGSARVQSVTSHWNSAFNELLIELKKITGHGVVLNTSFNKRGQPIVETPDEALALFENSALDALVIENYLIEKKSSSN